MSDEEESFGENESQQESFDMEDRESQKVLSIIVPSVSKLSESQMRRSHMRKKRRNKCRGVRPPWNCQEDLWRIYMQTFTEDARQREDDAHQTYGVFYDHMKRRAQEKMLTLAPAGICDITTLRTTPICQKMNVINRGLIEDEEYNKKRLWDRMRDPMYVDVSISPSIASGMEWPKLWPCSKRDVVRERQIMARKLKMKKMGASPCEIDEVDSPDASDDERLQELANLKELGHARIPPTAHKKVCNVFVDRASGENPGLVSGDYVMFELTSKKGDRTYANVVLRGMKGMHLPELTRTRCKTWKFCLYQAVIALLAKTQLRYKYAWSTNIDYIYDHAWLLFLHIGYLTVRPNQRFDDILVYNYKYSVEIELVQELHEVPITADMSFKHVEKSLRKQRKRPRKELTLTKSTFGEERPKDAYNLSVHWASRKIERWINQLDPQFTNCILRTSRFSVAFWQDGPFWYVYNPYRTDKLGFWNDCGAASISKFCSMSSMKRHLVMLVLRGYAFELGRKYCAERPDEDTDSESTVKRPCVKLKELISVEIYQLIYHSCQIHNVKLFQRVPRQPKDEHMVEKKQSDPCTFDPLAHLSPETCPKSKSKDEKVQEFTDKMEKTHWLRDMKITWVKRTNVKDGCEVQCKDLEEAKWHEFDVIEPRRLYVLWGEMHITDRSFAEGNRNRQTGACYAVCAGMTLINAPEYWDGEILNAIVVCGDKFFTHRNRKAPKPEFPGNPLSDDVDDDDWDGRPIDHFRIGETLFELNALPLIHGRLYVRTSECLWRSLEQLFHHHHFAILSCESTSLGVFKHCGAYYACDVRSYGPPIFEQGYGCAYLLRTSCLYDLVACIVLIIGSPECSKFNLRPLEIMRILDVGDECKKKKMKEKCNDGVKVIKPVCPCPFEDDKKKNKKKNLKARMEERKRQNAEKNKNVERTKCMG